MYKKLTVVAGAMATAMATSSALALQFDGFLTSGVAWHDDENKNRYLGALGDRGIQNTASFETDTRFGLQISSDIAEDMSVVTQILGTGVNDGFNAIVEWAYIDYKPTDWLSIRTGKIKQPVYLVNDYVEVGYAYPWIRPPAEIYYQNNPLNTVNGIEFLLQFPAGPGTISFQPYVGSNRADVPNTGGAGFFEAEKIHGIDVKYSARGFSMHGSSFACEVNMFGHMDDQPTAFGFNVDVHLEGEGKCEINAVGFNLDMANIVIYAEAQNRKTNKTLSRAFGDQESWYGTLGYRFGKWLPHITYASITGVASLETDAVGDFAVTVTGAAAGAGNVMNFPVAIQTSLTYGLRYEINDSAAFKIEHSIVDVEQDLVALNEANQGLNFGLFDTSFTNTAPTEKVGVTSIALDVVF